MFKPNGSTTTITFIVILALVPLPIILASPSPTSAPTNAHQRHHRRDPLHHFRYYDGDYDLRSKHYWASVAFTGIHGYALAGAWMTFGLGFGLLLIIKNSAANSTSESISHHSESSYYLVFSLTAVFTLLAITATGFILATNHQFLHETHRMGRTVLEAGSDAHAEINRVAKAMEDIQAYLCPYDSKTCALLSTTTNQLGNESLAIEQFMQKNGHLIDGAISLVYITNLVVVSFNLGLLVAALGELLCFAFSPVQRYTVSWRIPTTAASAPCFLVKTCYTNSSSSLSRCLPESYYTIAYAYIHSIQDLIGLYPDLDGLIHCSFVKNKISDADLHYCRPFKTSTRQLWIWMLFLSTVMVTHYQLQQ